MRDGWGTWNPDRPAELVDRRSGFTLTPLLYSAREGRTSLLPPAAMVYGPRAFGGGGARFRTAFAGTTLDWTYRFDDDGVAVDWRCRAHGEWGLRFWVVFAVAGPPVSTFTYDRATGVLRGHAAAGAVVRLRAAKDPLLVSFHDGLDALVDEFTDRGYFYLGSRGVAGGFAALRFNLEEAPALRLRVTADPRPPLRPVLPDDDDSGAAGDGRRDGAGGGPQQSLQAIHDVMAWNRVYDAVNGRYYTALTRNWNRQKFGGFGVWMNDVLYHALLWSLFDPAAARDDLDAVFVWQTDDGNLPCLVTGNDAWLDRSQPPIAAFAVWSLAQNDDAGDALLAGKLPALVRNHDWWWRRRRLGDTGLVAYGTSLDVGDGLYKGTKLAAKDESSMDNSPVHDPAPYNPRTGLLEAADVGLNSLLALDGELIAAIARGCGDNATGGRFAARSAAHRDRIRDWLWDDGRKVFANRLLSGAFVDALAPTSFYPLVAGAADAAQTDALLERYLRAPDKFGGSYRLPSVSRDNPAYADNVYWRGRVWAPLNFWVWHGLRRAGRAADATALAADGARLFHQNWRERRCGENYSADSGEILDQADSDPFYGWGALLAALDVAEVCTLTPWHGLSLAPRRAGDVFGPLRTPLGRLSIRNDDDAWSVERDGRPWLRGNLDGELRRLRAESGALYTELPATATPTWLSLVSAAAPEADIDGAAAAVAGGRVTIPPGPAGRRLRLSERDSAC